MMTTARKKWVLTVSCPGAAGQVASISSFLDRHRCYIDEFACFDDDLSGRFYVRCVFHVLQAGDATLPLQSMREGLEELGTRLGLDWQLHDMDARPGVLLLVSKFDHCLRDLLYRWRIGELPVDIRVVASNHPDLEPLVRAEGVPFYHLPVTEETKPLQEARLLDLLASSGSELVVLARYMQILSPAFCAQLHGRAINIHHSFLPGFKGAKPYHQAYARGVKLIGATAHYITTDLDEGPIIEQVVERVDHAHRPEDLMAVGRDMECVALARAVRFHVERRVFLNGSRTVVLR